MKTRIVIMLIGIISLIATGSHASQEDVVFRLAKKAARQGETDFAFMHYRTILRDGSVRYRESALFAHGEYFFTISDYKTSGVFFWRCVNGKKNTTAKLFALAYLLKIARMKNQEELINILEGRIRGYRRLRFLFKSSKEYQYTSPLNKYHTVIFSIEKAVFYVDDDFFIQVLY